MLAVAGLRGEEHARRTLRLDVAEMFHRVLALVASGARSGALGVLRSARHRRVDDGSSTLAPELVEGHARTRRAVADVTRALAAMLLALQLPAALLRAEMLQVDAAALIAFVLAARLELRALLLAPQVGAGEVLAGDFLFDAATSALNGSRLGARRAAADVARL